ncbi:MAG: Ribonuclease [Acidimicrobiales bacterium]|nr:Ribonuclease [Acidimicrobiales bacterium]
MRLPVNAPLDFAAVRRELEVPDRFPAEVEAAAAAAAAGAARPAGVDETAVPFVTVDPPGARDLDQAIHVARHGDGWRVRYAIADVATFATAGDPVDVEARRRGQTLYSPDLRTPLHPTALSERAASLLPGEDRPALLWTIDVDPGGTTTTVDLHRALVRSRAQLDYAGVQADIDGGHPPDALAELPALGAALLSRARQRDAIDLGLPEQEVEQGPDGRWTLALRRPLPVERWNAEVSLLTGRAAATLMLDAGIGLLRTLPPPDPALVAHLRRAARGLRVTWPHGASPGDVVAALDQSQPKHAAFVDLATELLRGAGYTAFDGAAPVQPFHAGVGAPYAHATAPLRRLCDRFVGEVCVAVAAGAAVPGWARDALPVLPELMAASDTRAKQLERAFVDLTEAFLLADRVGEEMPATVVDTGTKYGTVVIEEPAVRARCDTPALPLGDQIRVRCTAADVATRTVRFVRVA